MRRWRSAAWAILVLAGGLARADNAQLEISQEALNRLLARLGALSDGGLYQPMHDLRLPEVFEECFVFGYLDCPGFFKPELLGLGGNRIPLTACRTVGGKIVAVPVGPAIAWQWWVTDPHLEISQDSMTFTATVHPRINGQVQSVSRTVPARVKFRPTESRLQLEIDPFRVPVTAEVDGDAYTLTTVEVDKLYAISVSIEPQTFQMTVPGNPEVTAAVDSAVATYLPGRVLLRIDVEF